MWIVVIQPYVHKPRTMIIIALKLTFWVYVYILELYRCDHAEMQPQIMCETRQYKEHNVLEIFSGESHNTSKFIFSCMQTTCTGFLLAMDAK